MADGSSFKKWEKTYETNRGYITYETHQYIGARAYLTKTRYLQVHVHT